MRCLDYLEDGTGDLALFSLFFPTESSETLFALLFMGSEDLLSKYGCVGKGGLGS